MEPAEFGNCSSKETSEPGGGSCGGGCGTSMFSNMDALFEERSRLNADEFPLLTQVVDRELELIRTGQEDGHFIDLLSKKPTRVALKFKLPVKENPQVSYVGRIVGQSGKTVKHLHKLTGCKISVYGEGSIRDKAKEEELRQQGGKYSHLNFDLHVVIETWGPTVTAYQRITHAMTLLSALISPSYLEGSDPVGFLSLYNQSLGYSTPHQAIMSPPPPSPQMKSSMRGASGMRNMGMQRGSSRPPLPPQRPSQQMASSMAAPRPLPSPRRGGAFNRGRGNIRGGASVTNVQNMQAWPTYNDQSYGNDSYSSNNYADGGNAENGYTQENYDSNNYSEGSFNYGSDTDNSYAQENPPWNKGYQQGPVRRSKPITSGYRAKPY
ncbi:hypothetical protein HELRODRAFT_108276 [Helobdella robusta]|uniref:K Homology domain-containing protein n=1 Tax=Helobdella robusta TaxID=6412 RepID=T1EEH9_HELRO|nr:hypothetical protein HELRODRAFT_108276 [Helobdella robusta]ESN93089.1 hypothetical protein HELRODRAFT_108276 [Helobdella robusta]